MGSALAPGAKLLSLGPGGFSMVPVDATNADPLAQLAALQSAFTTLTARVTALEGRPEEVAHFGAVAAFPTAAALASFTVSLTGLTPAKPGDVLKAGESVAVQALAPLPDGVTMRGPPAVPVDGAVVLRFTATVALAAGSPIAWAISALR